MRIGDPSPPYNVTSNIQTVEMVRFMIVWFCWTLSIGSVSAEDVTRYSGENVTLNCKTTTTTGNNPVAVEWSRTDLGDEFVLLFRNDQIDPFVQHRSYKNRVDLADRQMKDGNVSLVLLNVTTSDNGTYKCRVLNQGSLDPELIRTIKLHVSLHPPPGDKNSGNQGGSIGLIVGLISSLLVFAAAVLFLMYKKQSACFRKKTSDPPADL